ncbi:hypothetical protein DPMN_025956 [Dreissena polymorpha]|uniref:Transmembrane protein n=1 Tax=Dreissena polymorpha TaxID=45954 RepID=A0A9D4RE42_DREPO|nr:hypothetical protein DPMN_025956 [Dreissena polymorpha]
MEFRSNTDDWQKRQLYDERRKRRKEKRKRTKLRLAYIRRLYIPVGMSLFLGIVILFGSSIEGLGEGTFLWKHQQYFRIIGAVLTVCGFIFMFIVVGCQSSVKSKLKSDGEKSLNSNVEISPLIHSDFIKERKRALHTETEKTLTQQSLHPTLELVEKKADVISCSSLSSGSSQNRSVAMDMPPLGLGVWAYR